MNKRQHRKRTPDRDLSQSDRHITRSPSPQVQAVVHHSRFEGPLPHPLIMEGYDKVIPGAAERILHMAEESVAFQQKISMAALSAQSNDTRRGQWFAFLVALCALITGGVAILTGNPVAGATIISTTLAGGVGTFVFVRRKSETSPTSDHEHL
ncbi:MAG: DUF2335 domain-containing protein [Magnetococcales bacterium]|nr:DUF2335 domain-containing protein [Magnetococcales bacterium]